MVNLAKVISGDTRIISDTHFGHFRILLFEPIRVKYLVDYNREIIAECHELLDLLKTIPSDEQRNHPRINELGKFLIPFHDEMLVEKWNSVVNPNEYILHLGDFAFKGIEEWTRKLNGNKILLRGNHDLSSAKTYIEAGWKDVIESVKIVVGDNVFEKTPKTDKYWNGLFTHINGKTVLFSHYPIFNSNKWDMKKYGYITDMLETIHSDIGGEYNIAGHTHSKLSNFKNAVNVSVEHCQNFSPVRIGDLITM